jgi:hypothetical protein
MPRATEWGEFSSSICQDLLGHKSGRITTHYSQAELTSLIEAADKVCSTESRKFPATTWLRRRIG